MVQLSKLLSNNFFYYCIKVYQLFFSRFTQKCIYKESCSDYALRVIVEKNSIYNNFRNIMKRINGCKVKEIVKCNKEDWYILNGHNEKVYINNISDFTISQVTKMIKK